MAGGGAQLLGGNRLRGLQGLRPGLEVSAARPDPAPGLNSLELGLQVLVLMEALVNADF